MKKYPSNLQVLERGHYEALLKLAFEEDRAVDDASTLAVFPHDDSAKATLVAREPGLLAGIEVFEAALLEIDSNISFRRHKADKDQFQANEHIIDIEGSIRTILRAERIGLNFISFMSGIATRTKKYADAAADYQVKLLDTRKTIPGFRYLSKYSTAVGGAQNHRMNLAEMGMLKDNHIAKAGNITKAIESFRRACPGIPLQVEIDSFSQLTDCPP